MNERIQALKVKAEKFADVFCEDIGDDDLNHWLDAFSDKLAELIVQECCQFEKSYSGDAGLVARSFSRKIKEHFGVE